MDVIPTKDGKGFSADLERLSSSRLNGCGLFILQNNENIRNLARKQK
jgi:hypothetical protein